jgi:hypothetical protein
LLSFHSRDKRSNTAEAASKAREDTTPCNDEPGPEEEEGEVASVEEEEEEEEACAALRAAEAEGKEPLWPIPVV